MESPEARTAEFWLSQDNWALRQIAQRVASKLYQASSVKGRNVLLPPVYALTDYLLKAYKQGRRDLRKRLRSQELRAQSSGGSAPEMEASKRRIEERCQQYQLHLAMPRERLSAELGLHPKSLERALKELREAELLTGRGRKLSLGPGQYLRLRLFQRRYLESGS